MLSNNRQHFNIYTIEFIETTPCTCRGKTFEEFTNHNIIHRIRTVEHHTLFCQSFSKILDRLCFTSSCWSSRCSSQIQLQSSHKSHIALISKRSNNQSQSISKILIAIREVGLNTPYKTIIIPVISKLTNPFKCTHIWYIIFPKFFYNIFCMHINDN